MTPIDLIRALVRPLLAFMPAVTVAWLVVAGRPVPEPLWWVLGITYTFYFGEGAARRALAAIQSRLGASPRDGGTPQ